MVQGSPATVTYPERLLVLATMVMVIELAEDLPDLCGVGDVAGTDGFGLASTTTMLSVPALYRCTHCRVALDGLD